MAFFHVLLNGSGTSGDGSTWDDASDGTSAYIAAAGLATIIAAAAAGDTIYVKGADTSTSATITLNFGVTAAKLGKPVEVIGVKAATTNLGGSIVQSDLVPGLRTGDATRAYDQTAGNAAPSITPTGTTADFNIRGFGSIYALVVASADVFDISSGDGDLNLEECKFTAATDAMRFGTTNVQRAHVRPTNCHISSASAEAILVRAGASGRAVGCVIHSADANNVFDFNSPEPWTFEECDFSGATSATLARIDAAAGGPIKFKNCKTKASHVLVTGTIDEVLTVINYGSDNTTGLTTGGSEQQYELESEAGRIEIETTAIRTGGANDGAAGGWSLAMTPNVDLTLENRKALISEPMHIWVPGDGTNKTLTVFIANSGAADYFNDDAWIAASYPSEAGVSQFDYLTTQMELLDTPAAIADDTDSTWGTGGNNPQKLQLVDIAPDYEGWIQVRIHFAKAFASSPEILYFDPKPELS